MDDITVLFFHEQIGMCNRCNIHLHTQPWTFNCPSFGSYYIYICIIKVFSLNLANYVHTRNPICHDYLQKGTKPFWNKNSKNRNLDTIFYVADLPRVLTHDVQMHKYLYIHIIIANPDKTHKTYFYIFPGGKNFPLCYDYVCTIHQHR